MSYVNWLLHDTASWHCVTLPHHLTTTENAWVNIKTMSGDDLSLISWKMISFQPSMCLSKKSKLLSGTESQERNICRPMPESTQWIYHQCVPKWNILLVTTASAILGILENKIYHWPSRYVWSYSRNTIIFLSKNLYQSSLWSSRHHRFVKER